MIVKVWYVMPSMDRFVLGSTCLDSAYVVAMMFSLFPGQRRGHEECPLR